MLNKGSEIVYLFILSYGHLDLLTSMYSYQDVTKFHGSGHFIYKVAGKKSRRAI
jgi:hypothetical protein